MSLIHCPECGHETSSNAVACPNCGRPVTPTPLPVEEKVFVSSPPIREDNSFPPWAFIPIGILALILLMVAYVTFRQGDEQANTNLAVNVARRQTVPESHRETTVTSVPPSTSSEPVTVPGQTTTVPGTTTSVPVEPAPVKGKVVIKAQVSPLRGAVQPGKNIKFYLLDKDVETILSEAHVSPIEGNSLTASLGLAAVFPDRYGEFQRAAIKAIGEHVKYTGTSGSDGSATMGSIDPKQYYLYGINRMGHGFVLWNSPVSVIAGENLLDLEPQRVVEIPET